MKLISSRQLYNCKLFTVTEEVAKDPDGFEIHRLIVRHPGSAVVMPVDDKRRVLLVRQFRLPAAKELWELPAGRLDPGETPLKAARRELVEETGYRAAKWVRLASFWPTPGYVGEKMTVFLATGLTEGEAEPMEDERIRLGWFTIRQMDEMIRGGEIVDGKTILGFLMWQRYGKFR
ncbi:MAG: NUDIX hydrolase [Bryobacterales bacterium]|nr:NUDIX hydrolase [Bryobacterales bacterium]